MYAQLEFVISRCDILIVFLKDVIKEYNLSLHNFNVVIVDCSNMLWLLQSFFLLSLYVYL
jgi:hypothetical protein